MANLNMQSISRATSIPKIEKYNTFPKGPEKVSFGQWLNRSIQSVSDAQNAADVSALKLANGQTKDIHGTMIKMQKAEIATSLLVEVRNKVIAAYEEVKRMQF